MCACLIHTFVSFSVLFNVNTVCQFDLQYLRTRSAGCNAAAVSEHGDHWMLCAAVALFTALKQQNMKLI